MAKTLTANMTTAAHVSHGNGINQNDREILKLELSYNEMTVGANGSVMDKKEKAALRQRHGFCVECIGVPVELYIVKKSRMNPLWVSKEPRNVAGESMDGVCLVCHPDQDPNRKIFRRRPRNSAGGLSPVPGGVSVPSTFAQSSTSHPQPTHPPFGGEENGVMTAPVAPRSDPQPRPTQPLDAKLTSSPPPPPPADPAGVVNRLPIHQSRSPLQAQRSTVPLQGKRSLAPPSSPLHPQRPGLRTAQSARRKKPVFDGGMYVVASDRSQDLTVEDTKLPELGEDMGDDLDQIFSNAMDKSTRSLGLHSQSAGSNDFHMSAPLESTTTAAPAPVDAPWSHESPARPPQPPPVVADHSSRGSRTQPNDVGSAGVDQVPTTSEHSHGTASTPSLNDAGSQHVTRHEPDDITFGDTRETSSQQQQSSNEDDEQVAGIVENVQSFVNELTSTPGVDSGFLAEVILGAMREHQMRVQVQVYCLRAIWDVCKDDDKNKDACMTSGAPEDIMRAMQKFPQSLPVQEKGCGAIWSLGVNTDNRVILVRQGACTRVVQALDEFTGVESLARTAVGALRTLSPELEAREAFKQLKASEKTSRAMGLHRASVSIQRDGCAFLSNCAVNIEKQFVAVVPVEELDAVVQAMQSHRDEVAVMAGGCFALKNYTYEQANCRTLRQCGGIEELLAYAASFERSSACRTDAAELLERMQLSRVADESMESHASLKLQTSIAEARSPSDSLRTIMEFMRANDWSPNLVASGIMCLRQQFVENELLREQLVHNGGLADVIRLLRKHERDADLMEEGCRMMAGLASGSEANQTLLSSIIGAGQSTVIFSILKRHVKNRQVVRAALGALEPLSKNFDCWCDQGGGKNRIDIVRDAVDAHPDCDTVKLNGVAIISSHEIFEQG